MRIAIAASAAALALALAGCGSTAPSTEESARETGVISLTNTTAEEVAKQTKAAAAKQIVQQPGEWEITQELVSYDLSAMGNSPERQFQEALMSGQKGKPMKTTRCMKAEDFATQREAEVAQLTRMGGNCSFARYAVQGDKFDAAMTCNDPQGKVDVAITGTQSPALTERTMTMKQAVPGGKGQIQLTSKATIRRVGDCKG